jgi:hypothetical protein
MIRDEISHLKLAIGILRTKYEARFVPGSSSNPSHIFGRHSVRLQNDRSGIAAVTLIGRAKHAY